MGNRNLLGICPIPVQPSWSGTGIFLASRPMQIVRILVVEVGKGVRGEGMCL